jgi:hypothetical protein
MDYVLRSTVNNPLRRLCFGTFSVEAFLVPQAPRAVKGKGAGRGNEAVTKVLSSIPQNGSLPRSRLSMSRSLVSRVCSLFFLHRAFAVVVALGFVALHRVSIRTLDELS